MGINQITVFQRSMFWIGFALFQFSIARISIYLIYPDAFSPLSALNIFSGFLEGLRFDLASSVVFLILPILLIIFPIPLFQKKLWVQFISWIVFIILLAQGLFLVADIKYFQFTSRHIGHEVLEIKNDLFFFADSLRNESLVNLVLVLLALIIGIKLFAKFVSVTTAKSKYHFFKFCFFSILLLLFGRGGYGSKPLAIIDAYASGNSYKGNLVLNGVFTASQSAIRSKNVLYNFYSEEEMQKTLSYNKNKYPLEKEIPPHKENKKYNLVLMTIEALSYRYLDSFANKNYKLTPFLDSIASRGVKFTRFYSHGQRSLEGIQSTLTSLPSLIGVPGIAEGSLSNYTRIGNTATDNGYSSLYFTSMQKNSSYQKSISRSLGFQNYYSQGDMPVLLDYPFPDHYWGWDYEMLMFSADKLNKIQKPFFAFMFPSADHTPFPVLPKKFMKYPHHPEEESGYLNLLGYTDWALQQFFQKIESMPWFKNTIFVITGDHVIAHYQSGDFLEKFRVPLIIYAPEIFQPQTIETVTSHLDLLPTIYSLLSWKGKYSSMGENIFSKKENFAWVRQGSIIGAITDKAFLKHSLKNRLEYKSLQEELPEIYFLQLEKKLLSLNQLSFQLINNNTWASP